MEVLWTGDVPALVSYLRAILTGLKPVLVLDDEDPLKVIRHTCGVRLVKDISDVWGNPMADMVKVGASDKIHFDWKLKVRLSQDDKSPSWWQPWHAYHISEEQQNEEDTEYQAAWDQLMDFWQDWNTTILPEPETLWNYICPCVQRSVKDYDRVRLKSQPPFDGLCGECRTCKRFIQKWATEFYCDEFLGQ